MLGQFPSQEDVAELINKVDADGTCTRASPLPDARPTPNENNAAIKRAG